MRTVQRLFIVGILVTGLTLIGCAGDDGSSGSTTDTGTTGETDAGGDAPGTGTDTATDTDTTTGEDTTTATGTDTATGTNTDTDTSVPDTIDAGACQDLSSVTFGDWAVHATSVLLADQADWICDSNNNGSIDDDGSLNTILLGNLISGVLDVNGELSNAVADGTLISLMELTDYTGEDGDVTAKLYVGEDIDSQPDPTCGVAENLEQVCDWYIDPDSFDENCEPLVSVAANVTGGALTAGPADFMFTFLLNNLALDLPVNSGRILGTIAGNNLTNGQLCGMVTKQAINDAIDVACNVDPPPEFCASTALLQQVLNCDPCGVILALEGIEANSIGLAP